MEKIEGWAELVWVDVVLPSEVECKDHGLGGGVGHPERVSKPTCGNRAGLCRRPLLAREGASQAFLSTLKRPLGPRMAGLGSEHPHHLNACGLKRLRNPRECVLCLDGFFLLNNSWEQTIWNYHKLLRNPILSRVVNSAPWPQNDFQVVCRVSQQILWKVYLHLLNICFNWAGPILPMNAKKPRVGVSQKAIRESLLCSQMLPVQIKSCAVALLGKLPRRSRASIN